ncbi:phospholipid/glycerol acyltransferase [Anaeromyxobacter dehalogenans 2CP-1]|uniref:Phospholipid/glycerol acyltransferase n=1 Tax=Anaeromyxobacter dehalogenans (strain ATCC BAA-258 / DSM 21875 / 2CP-1) TaxID=455488 RepID=B8JBK7_ANAD2|nr:lysophospholipid acyltransferase family protein [Anaeromyxobacter dehalogenans]ACL67615.1 phospholipid/glycerol acyltransferase [Anaeromyxobacter dehalogenans 2CP-1]
MSRHAPHAPPPPLDPRHPAYRWILGGARRLARYHRMTVEGTVPQGPCVYVALHGAGYLVLDLVLACYFLGWKEFHESGRREDWRPLRIVGAESQIERFLPGLPRVKEHAGIIGTDEEDCVAVLERGESLLVTPGGMREAQPSRDFYRLRWDGRLGFARMAVRTGVPIVPVAVVGGAEAYPGVRWGKLSFWSPLPLPARMEMAIGEPIPVERRPESARDPAVVKPLQELARARTQALYDRLIAQRGTGR